MSIARIKLAVNVDLDPVPGVFNTIASAERCIQDILNMHISHYKPTVSFEKYIETVKHTDQAILVTEESTRPGGIFFMNDQAIVGHYYIKSDLEEKRDLVLPPRIFRKCFVFVDGENPNAWRFVEEIA